MAGTWRVLALYFQSTGGEVVAVAAGNAGDAVLIGCLYLAVGGATQLMQGAGGS